jgi:hypothetical protein
MSDVFTLMLTDEGWRIVQKHFIGTWSGLRSAFRVAAGPRPSAKKGYHRFSTAAFRA